ncbi:MAG: DUF4440 domain-containing protein [Acidovorax sp.]|nr:DUF4440 domain-containing protein [Acidovorax sp.]
MPHTTPQQLLHSLVGAMNRGDIDAATAHYEPNAVLVVQPGVEALGFVAIREALSGMLAGRPQLVTLGHHVFRSGNLALCHSSWQMTIKGPDGSLIEMKGLSADVLRQQSDGTWRIAIDNPWGTAVLGAVA